MTEQMKSQPAKHDGESLPISEIIQTAGLDPKALPIKKQKHRCVGLTPEGESISGGYRT
jgi:hypothetical protein